MADAGRVKTLRYKVAVACAFLAAVTGCAFAYARFIYEPYENFVFANAIAGRKTFSLHALLSAAAPSTADTLNTESALGSIAIARLGITQLVRRGVDAETLREAAGHPVFTSLPGGKGNFVVIAPNLSHWRKLESIVAGDAVTFQPQYGSALTYRIAATAVLKPSDVSVLGATGGTLIRTAGSASAPPRLLTIISTYPFSASGSAPSRFVAEGILVEPPPVPTTAAAVVEPEPEKSLVESPAPPHRRVAATRHTHLTPTVVQPAATPPKRRGFWHKMLHALGG